MIKWSKDTDERGFTLLEAVVSILLIVIAMGATASYQLMSKHAMQTNDDRVFAIQKATQIIEELRAYAESDAEHGVKVLDLFDDSTSYSYILTTDTLVTLPNDPLSGNRLIGNQWRFCRRVSVEPVTSQARARKVTVRVFYTDRENPSSPTRVLGEVSTVLATIGESYPPTQSFDVYVLALESVPGWWTDMQSMWPAFQAAVAKIEARNPGLRLNTHWITRMSYGRDPYYRPHLNRDRSPTDPIDWVYFYPGTVDPSNDVECYITESFRARIHADDTLFMNSNSYSLADQFNHAMRYPDELDAYYSYVASNPEHEMSYRMFLEELINYPEDYENAIIVNLHGEMVPIPPVRNYSDPAKDPVNHAGMRVVVHPESLYYNSSSEVTLRVYPYSAYPDSSEPSRIDTVCVRVVGGVDLSGVEVIVGDDSIAYAKKDAVADSDYTSTDTGDTLTVWLYNSPTLHPYNSTTSQGLPVSERLYGLEYIPCPVETTSDFSRDLTSAGGDIPKNTARWIIRLSNKPDETVITVETSIGGSISAYPNMSRTYAWVAEVPPITEQFQMLGDPRHNPYADVKMRGDHNRYFVSVPGNYGGFSDTRSGWETYMGNTVPDNDLDCDVWRLTELLRTGLLRSHSIFIPMSGFTSYYLGFGGEIGGIGSHSLNGGPWNSASAVTVDEVTDTGSNEVKSRVPAAKDMSWKALPWIGELWPDKEFDAYWDSVGNLPTSAYYRADYEDAGLPYYRVKQVGNRGCATFVNGIKSSGNYYFMHEHSVDAGATMTELGKLLDYVFDIDIPEQLPAHDPFELDYGSWARKPVNWEDYTASRCTTEMFSEYYASTYGGYSASASVFLGKNSDWSYFFLNGLSHSDIEGAKTVGGVVLAGAVDCFMRAGEPYTVEDYRRIRQLPRAEIVSPRPLDEHRNPSHIKVAWKVDWLRWDGEKYTPDYSESFQETTEVVMCLKYTDDGGKTWRYVSDNALTETGTRPGSAYELIDVYTYNWDVSSLPQGDYLVRLEAYRGNIIPHYAHHQVRVFIERDET